MAEVSASATRESGTSRTGRTDAGGGGIDRPAPPGYASDGGLFSVYKPEQGKWTRGGTFAGALLLALWGGYFVYQKLNRFEGDQWWHLVIMYGIPTLYAAGGAALAWWLVYVKPETGDFMIATEGEMKKVSWSSRREVIGSTKVVIVVTLLLALLLFLVDTIFIRFFEFIGVLRLGGS